MFEYAKPTFLQLMAHLVVALREWRYFPIQNRGQ